MPKRKEKLLQKVALAKKLRQSTNDQHVTAIIPTLTATTSTPDTNHTPSSHLPPPSPSTVSTSHFLIVTCTNCENGTEFSDKEARTNTGKKTSLQENNVKGIYEAVNNNIGLSGLNRVISTLGFNSLSKGKFTRYANFVYEEMGIKYPAMMLEGIKGMFQLYENCGIFPDPTIGLLDITVSY
ncbi:hypothetical protein Pmani_014328 [Petrolisthes manimaculis]|uniref:Uncharacterized protein n=1 Tax=Petrolisthes manimaculis TaxID=1843537 RepID=A0AAE1UD79_9EUCA|nr:hypothetical protein Pmani_014328 [Petrolisthes manimaculis]